MNCPLMSIHLSLNSMDAGPKDPTADFSSLWSGCTGMRISVFVRDDVGLVGDPFGIDVDLSGDPWRCHQ